VIEPTFNKERLGSPDAIEGAVKSLSSLQETKDNIAKKNVKKAWDKAQKAKKKAAEEEAKKPTPTKKTTRTPAAKTTTTKAATKPTFTYKGRKPTAAAIQRQNAAAKASIIRKPRGGELTPAQVKQNDAYRSYMTPVKKTSVPGQSGASKGRPDTKAATKTVGPGVNKMAKATVNKTGARNVRKSTKVTPVTKPPAVKPVNGAGRRTNGAPKKRMR
jgi:hypothetical protein